MLSSRRSLSTWLAITSLVLYGHRPLLAQGTGVVPAANLSYADLDRLVEVGVADAVMGQRPYSRRELARIIRSARVRLDAARSGSSLLPAEVVSFAEPLLERLEQTMGTSDDSSFAPVFSLLDGASLVANATDAQRRGFFGSATRALEATIDPLADRRLGTPATTGKSVWLELSHRVEPASWLALQLRERVEYRPSRTTPGDHSDAELLLASARARFGNVALVAGRQQVAWAPSAGDGLFLASDAPALDGVSLASDHPFALPSLFRWLGPAQTTLVVADLGPSRVRSHSRLVAYKVTISPARDVELGGTFLDHFGGAGARSSALGSEIIDLLPFLDVFRHHNYEDTTRALDVDSDKMLGMDARWRIPALGGVTLAGELLIDDFDVHRLPKLLTGYGSQTFALTIPRIGTPAISARLSAKHMGILTYSHSALTDGFTTRYRLLGDELGPDAKSFGAQLRWQPSGGVGFTVEGRSNVHSSADYDSFYTDSAHTRWEVRKSRNGGDEQRELVLGSMVLQRADGFAFTVRGGVERIRNVSFRGARVHDYVLELALRHGL